MEEGLGGWRAWREDGLGRWRSSIHLGRNLCPGSEVLALKLSGFVVVKGTGCISDSFSRTHMWHT